MSQSIDPGAQLSARPVLDIKKHSIVSANRPFDSQMQSPHMMQAYAAEEAGYGSARIHGNSFKTAVTPMAQFYPSPTGATTPHA